MITVRTSNLTAKEVDELYRVLTTAQLQLCEDSTGKVCANCEWRKLCNNLNYVNNYLIQTSVNRKN